MSSRERHARPPVAGRRRGGPAAQRHALVGEDADPSLRLGQPHGSSQGLERPVPVARGVAGQRQEHRHLDGGSARPPALGGLLQSFEELHGVGERRRRSPTCRVLGQQESHERHLLVLAGVADVVAGRQPLFRCPPSRRGKVAGTHPHPRTARAHRPHVRCEVTDVEAFGLLEQGVGATPVAVRCPQVRHGDPPPVRLLGQAGALPELGCPAQVVRRGGRVTALPGDAAQRHPMSAVPRTTPPSLDARARSRAPVARFLASARRPSVRARSTRVTVHPSTSATCRPPPGRAPLPGRPRTRTAGRHSPTRPGRSGHARPPG